MNKSIILMIIHFNIIILNDTLQYVFKNNMFCLFLIVFTCNVLTSYFISKIEFNKNYIIMLINISLLFVLSNGFIGSAIVIGNIIKHSCGILITLGNSD